MENHWQWLFCLAAFLYLSHTNTRNTRGVLGLLEFASTCREAHTHVLELLKNLGLVNLVKALGPKDQRRVAYVCILGLHEKVLLLWRGLQEWLLWQVARSFPHVQWSQHQLAPRQTHCWPRPSQSGMVILPLRQHIFKKEERYCVEVICGQRKEAWEYVRGIALHTPGEWRKRGKRCFRCPRWDSPAVCGKDRGEAAVPLQLMEVHRRAQIRLLPMEEQAPGRIRL